MADVNYSSWTCVSEGDKVAVFDDVFSVLMTPEEVLKKGERLTTFTKENSANEVDGVMLSGYNDQGQNLVSLCKIINFVVVSFNHLTEKNIS